MSDERTISKTRIVPYKREQVFKAWTTPELLRAWWDPQNFTVTMHTFELRPGGKWQYTLHDPNGSEYGYKLEFGDIVAPGLVVIRYNSDQPLDNFYISGIFTETGAKTHIEVRHVFESTEACARKKVWAENIEQDLDRLEAVLKKM